MTLIGKYFSYFEISSKNTPTSTILIIIFLIFEYFPISFLNFLSITQIRTFFQGKQFNITDSILFKISFLKYILPLISMENSSETSIQLIITLILVLLLIIIFILSWMLRDENLTKHLELMNKRKKNSNSFQIMNYLIKTYHFLLSWFYDIFFFRILSFWIIFALINSSIVSDNLKHASLTEIIIRILTLIIYCLTVVIYFQYTFVYIKYEPNHKNYPYDEFSSHFEIVLFINKILIAVEFNTFLFNNNSILWMWAVCINTFSLGFYLLLTIFRLYKYSSFIIFYRNTEINTFRIFYLVFYMINLIIHLAFNINYNLAFIFVYYICLISLSIVITINLYQKQETNIIEGNDSINKILHIIDLHTMNREKQLKRFTKKLSISHMNKCSSDFVQCKICTIFKHIFVNNSNKFLGFSNNIKINVLELVDGVFTVNKHLFDETSTKYMVITSFILLNTSRSNTYLLNMFYSKRIVFFKKNFPVLAMNLMTYFKNIISSDMNSLVQVHTIMEQENYKNKMKTFLELFKEILCGIDEKPEFIVETSKQMNKIQIAMKKHLVSKYENSLDYQIIILKYMYEKILNTKIKSKGGNIFSFQLYDDLLQEHYTFDQFFLLSYDIPMKTFEIIRTSREYCKYTSHSFESLFPFKNVSKLHLEQLMSSVKENNLLKTSTNSFSKKSHLYNSTIQPTKNNQTLMSTTSHENTSSSYQKSHNQHHNIFEFPIQDPEYQEYICSFKMNFKIFPTTDLKLFLSICFYQNQFADVVITVCDKILKEEKVVSFSLLLKEYFLISPSILNFLTKFNRNILFNDLFRLNNSDHKIGKGSIFETNYKKYLPIINNDLQFYFDSETSLSEDDKNKIMSLLKKEKKLETEKKKPKTIELLSISEFDSKTNHNVLLRVYYFKNKMKTRKYSKFEKDKSSNEDANISLSKNNYFSTNNDKKTDYQVFNSTSSMTKGSSEKATTLHGSIDLLKQSINDEKTKRNPNNKLSFFTCVILIYNLLLIVVTVIFLVLEINKNKVFQKTFSFYQTWNGFSRLFMHSTLSSFFLFCPAKDNQNKCERKFDFYSEGIKNFTNIHPDFKLNEYFQEELKFKVDKYQKQLSAIKSKVYEQNKKNLIEVGETKIISYSFSENQGKYKVVRNYVSFFDDLSIFLNLLNSVSNDNSFKHIPMQFLSKFVNGSLNLQYLQVENKNSSKLDAYLILINYRVLLQKLEEMTKIVTINLLDDIKDCKFIGNFLSVFLITNHVAILFICLCCMVIFKNILKNHCIMITEKLNQQILIEAIKEKVNILSKFILFYKENPNTLFDNYQTLKTQTKLKLKVSDKDIFENNTTNQNPSNIKLSQNTMDFNLNNDTSPNTTFEKKGTLGMSNKNDIQQNTNKSRNLNYLFSNLFQNTNTSSKRIYENADFHPMLKKTFNIIIIVFLCYFIYSILYLILLLTTLDDYSNLITTFSHNSNLDFSIFSTASILPVMLFTNQTDLEMQTMYTTTEIKEGYISSTLKNCYRFLSYVEIAENPRQKKIVPLKKSVDLSCDKIYSTLDDYLFVLMKEWHFNKTGSDDIEDTISKIFCSFPSSKYKDDKMWIKDLIYRGIKLNSKVAHNLDNLYRITTSQEIFEMYLLVLLNFRPIRNFESTHSFLSCIYSLTKKYNIVVYTYLVLNTFFEMVLFYVLKYFVIEDYSFINQSLDLLLSCMNI